MAEALPLVTPRRARPAVETLLRVVTYSTTRLVALFLTVVVGVYLTILVANMGGYVDVIKRTEIREQVGISVSFDPTMQRLPAEERQKRIEELVKIEEERLGLDRPFLVRTVVYLREALRLRLGFAERMTSDTGSRLVRNIILDRLPPTLLLFVSAQLLLFFASVFAALALSRRYGSPLDRAVIALAPTSAPPAWFYGIFLILIFAALLRVLPFGGMVDAPPPQGSLAYAASVLRHMILPMTALFLTTIFLSVYSWRTFFLIFSSEDYVEVAKAKGLTSRAIERRYILRPTLPTIVTSFALSLIGAWTGAIVLETVFNWPGLGRALFQAIGLYDTPVIVGATIIYAYLLAVTVFVLDILYALIDPRVKVGLEGQR
ncbi:MAG: ABC transporter permease [Armatimonadota bacterium]|nr:ABC transporter permease [Armatimonadota bacterium]MDR7426428.1 ABC transporter permease [Armatimonadota bacterium]MDR7469559.1 ABC transporter permease [Armatimonadota bacterium]MDR7473433.1 ABC transporter permease [Armatimonadota bacterium]MDR7540258.1 ABC transporter permease [Armatimonadota bacterium]